MNAVRALRGFVARKSQEPNIDFSARTNAKAVVAEASPTRPFLAPDAHARLWQRVSAVFGLPVLGILVAAVAASPPGPASSGPIGPAAPAQATFHGAVGAFVATGVFPSHLIVRKAILAALSDMGLQTLTYRGQRAARVVPRTASLQPSQVTLTYDVYPSRSYMLWPTAERLGAAVAILHKLKATPAAFFLHMTYYVDRYVASHSAHGPQYIHALHQYRLRAENEVVLRIHLSVRSRSAKAIWYVTSGRYATFAKWTNRHHDSSALDRMARAYARTQNPPAINLWSRAEGFTSYALVLNGRRRARIAFSDAWAEIRSLGSSLDRSERVYANGSIVSQTARP